MKLRSNKNLKIGVAVPCRDTVHSLFTNSLVNLITANYREHIPTELYMISGSLIADQRQKLANTCINDNCSHILWVDSDMMFPAYTAIKLLSHNKNVVAGNYSTRSEPRKSVAYKTIGDWNSWLNSSKEIDKLTSVAAVGMGCMLTDIRIYETMTLPFFEIKYDHDLKEWIGEDFYFCKKILDSNNEIYIDNLLSMEIYHLGTTAYQIQTL